MSASHKLSEWVNTCRSNPGTDTSVLDSAGNCGEWRVNQGRYNPKFQLPIEEGEAPLERPPILSFRWTNATDRALKLYYLQSGAWVSTNKPLTLPGESTLEGNVAMAKPSGYLYRAVDEDMNTVSQFQVTQEEENVIVRRTEPQGQLGPTQAEGTKYVPAPRCSKSKPKSNNYLQILVAVVLGFAMLLALAK